jgi:two-component system OmpR family response regulator
MITEPRMDVFLVDDDAVFLKSLAIEFLQHPEFSIGTFATGELCISNLSDKPDMIVLDYHLNGVVKNAINGMTTLDKIKSVFPEIPVVILSSQDSIDVAVNCMHHGAFDYVVKSETAFVRLRKIAATITKYKKLEKELNWYMERV